MKRMMFVLLIVTLFSALAAQNQLKELYYRDYGDILRLVLVFDKAPDMTLQPSAQLHQLVVKVNNTTRSAKVQDAYTLSDSRVLDAIESAQQGNTLTLTIRTDGTFTHQRPTQGIEPNRVVLDIYNVAKPATVQQHASFARFYSIVGYASKANAEFAWLKANAGDETDYQYDWGMMLLSRKKKAEAAQHFRMVKPGAASYAEAQKELAKLDDKPATPQPQPQKPEPKPAVTPPPAPQKTDEFTKQWNAQIDGVAKEDGKRFMLAIAAVSRAAVTGAEADFKQAERLLGELDEKSPLREAQQLAHYILDKAWGKDDKAAQYAGEAKLPTVAMNAASITPSSGGVLSARIPLGLALMLAVLVGLIVFFLMLIYYGHKRRQGEPEYSLDDIRDHSETLEEQFHEVFNGVEEEIADEPEPEEEPEPEIDEEPEEEPDFEFEPEQQEESTHVDLPPEMPDEEDLPAEDETPIDDGPGIGDPEYQKKMILKLSADGWDTEAIAKELQISQREVDFIIKTQS